jgi:hypothetical protein
MSYIQYKAIGGPRHKDVANRSAAVIVDRAGPETSDPHTACRVYIRRLVTGEWRHRGRCEAWLLVRLGGRSVRCEAASVRVVPRGTYRTEQDHTGCGMKTRVTQAIDVLLPHHPEQFDIR